MKRLFAIFCAAALLLCGCNGKAAPAGTDKAPKTAYPITINGMSFTEAPQSVVCLSPSLTDIVCELGLAGLLAGRGDCCDNPAVADITAMGNAVNPDCDAIIAAAPSLLLTATPLSQMDSSRLSEAGVRVWKCAAPTNLTTLRNLYSTMIAVLCGASDHETRAEELVAPIEKLVSETPKTEVCVLALMNTELSAATGDTLLGSLISSVAVNCAEDYINYSVPDEELRAMKPQIVLADNSLLSQQLPDFGGARIVYADLACFDYPSTEITAAAEALCAAVSEESA